jgi:hypothetical protein
LLRRRHRKFRSFARHSIVAECFAAIEPIEKRRTLLSHIIKLRREDVGDGQHSFDDQSGIHTSEPPDLFGVIPTSRVKIECAEKGCGAGFMVSHKQRQFYAASQWNIPTRCEECHLMICETNERKGSWARRSRSRTLFKCAMKTCGAIFEHSHQCISYCAERVFKPASTCETCRDRRNAETVSYEGSLV